MATTKPPSSDAYEAAKSLYFSLPERDRSARGITKTLNERGIAVSKTSIGRWIKGWKGESAPVTETAQRLLPAPAGEDAVDAEAEGIPRELRNALSPRLLALASGKGLDRVENAAIVLSNAIAGRSHEIAAMLLESETETESVEAAEGGGKTTTRTEKANVARSAVTAVATLASAMEALARARSLSSMQHRNFAEGDMLLAEAERKRAEARLFDADAQAKLGQTGGDNARVVDGEFTEISADERRDALEALAGQVSGK